MSTTIPHGRVFVACAAFPLALTRPIQGRIRRVAWWGVRVVFVGIGRSAGHNARRLNATSVSVGERPRGRCWLCNFLLRQKQRLTMYLAGGSITSDPEDRLPRCFHFSRSCALYAMKQAHIATYCASLSLNFNRTSRRAY